MTSKDIEFNKAYWNDFYQSNHKHTPSQFCVCVLTEISPNAVVVELGSGNGRDSHYFASQGHVTVAMDLSQQAVESCTGLAKERSTDHSTFFQGDITSKESVLRIVRHARLKAAGNELVFYSRFVMHSIDDEQELMFLETLSTYMQPDETVYFEFRSKEDADLKKHYGGHFRRYVDTDVFKKRLTNDYKFEISYSLTGQGMAKFQDEDPFVTRLIARKIGA